MSKTRATFKIKQDPIDHPNVDRGKHVVTADDLDACWEQIERLAEEICDDEFTITLVKSQTVNEGA